VKTFLMAALVLAGGMASAADFTVTLDRPGALYKCGEPAVFTVTAEKPEKATVYFRLEKQKLLREETVDFSKTNPAKFEITLDQPGFVWCSVNNPDNVEKPDFVSCAGFDPEKIQATTVDPADFDQFWADGIKRVRATPLDLKMTRLEDFDNPDCVGYKFSCANYDGSRVWGFLTVPRTPGKYPAIMGVPPAGPGVSNPDLFLFGGKDVIRLIVNVHDYDPADRDEAWKKLGEEKGTYSYYGAPDREKYYHRRAILGAERAFEVIEKVPEWDGRHIGLWGSSQGGGYALILAGLNPGKVDFVVSNVPAMCEHTAHLAGRSSGWPLLLENTPSGTDKMAPYFDVVNFARRIDCPVMICVGLLDVACGPSSVYAAYNQIKTAKSIFPAPRMGHSFDPGFNRRANIEMRKHLGLAP